MGFSKLNQSGLMMTHSGSAGDRSVDGGEGAVMYYGEGELKFKLDASATEHEVAKIGRAHV